MRLTPRPRRSAPAKITPPRLGTHHPRAEIFRRLDAARRRPIVWVMAPAGAGKTVVAASYLAARKARHLWYQVDAGDHDPATLFHYLGLAARSRSPRRPPLPSLEPVHLAAFGVFARRFFEQLWVRVRLPAVLVLDDYQEVPAGSPFHVAVAELASTLPDGATLLVLSHQEPPPAFARLRVQDAISLVGPDRLALRSDEARHIARARGRADLGPADVQRLRELSGGWAAGFVLLLERAVAGQRSPAAGEAPVLFDYFATEVLGKLGEADRDLLLQCALLPSLEGSLAERLTVDAAAPRLLAALQRHGTFTVRHGDEGPFELHPLFRSFLIRQAGLRFDPARLAALRLRAATLTEEAGQLEASAQLLREARDPGALAAFVLRHAPALTEQGRSATVREWLGALPPDLVGTSPWLSFWMAASQAATNPAEASTWYQRAFELALAVGDDVAIFTTWASGASHVFFSRASASQLVAWLARYDQHLAQRPFPPGPYEARTRAAHFFLVMLQAPRDPATPRAGQRALDLASRLGDESLRLQVLCFLAVYQLWSGDIGGAGVTISTIGPGPDDEASGLSPFLRTTVKTTEALHTFYAGAFEGCRKAVAACVALAERTGVQVWTSHVLMHGVAADLADGEVAAAVQTLAALGPRRQSMERNDLNYFNYLMVLAALSQGDLPRAEAQLALIEEDAPTALPYEHALLHQTVAQLMLARGRPVEALAALDRAIAVALAVGGESLEYASQLLRALALHELGRDADGLTSLRRAMALGAHHGYRNFYGWDPTLVARACALALAHGIEPAYVTGLIRARQLAAPPHADAWPWPVAIRTLGRFEVRLQDMPLTFTGKAQRRPLEVLMALVALGGRDVPVGALARALWPGVDASSARQSLHVALHRLRRLLGHDGAVTLSEQRLALDSSVVWVDASAFERLISKDGEGASCTPARLAAALALYRGPFLPGCGEAAWAVPRRERMRAHLVGRLSEVCRQLTSDRDQEAVQLLERGLDVEPQAEVLYRELIVRHVAAGRRAEAAAAYRRCERSLHALLGTRPAESTRALIPDAGAVTEGSVRAGAGPAAPAVSRGETR
jgi:ATP/maltotriose-dependent transcriptional regulator MalT/DNA-binding SARP family transcriptional activator